MFIATCLIGLMLGDVSKMENAVIRGPLVAVDGDIKLEGGYATYSHNGWMTSSKVTFDQLDTFPSLVIKEKFFGDQFEITIQEIRGYIRVTTSSDVGVYAAWGEASDTDDDGQPDLWEPDPQITDVCICDAQGAGNGGCSRANCDNGAACPNEGGVTCRRDHSCPANIATPVLGGALLLGVPMVFGYGRKHGIVK